MINCSSLAIRLEYEHVDVHQNNGKDYALLKRPAKRNCMCDGMTKGVVWGLAGKGLPKQWGNRPDIQPKEYILGPPLVP